MGKAGTSVAVLYCDAYGFCDRLSQTLARGITKANVATEMVDLLSTDPQVRVRVHPGRPWWTVDSTLTSAGAITPVSPAAHGRRTFQRLGCSERRQPAALGLARSASERRLRAAVLWLCTICSRFHKNARCSGLPVAPTACPRAQELTEILGRSNGVVIMTPPRESKEAQAALATMVSALKSKHKVGLDAHPCGWLLA